MELINLETGKIFTSGQPYTLWIGSQCSIGLVYNKSICFISKKQSVDIRLSSDVFSLLDMSEINSTEDINDFKYVDIKKLKTRQITSVGVKYNDNIYIHIIYISAQYSVPGEYIDDIYIDNDVLSVGIDLYDDNESLYINMSNMGINIPNSVQKAIYSTNVHNDFDDKILLNRKWKELLSNYWDVIANKGSYKSLMNSLKWFEWGDLLKIKELWKYSEINNRVRYKESDIVSYIADLYNSEMSRFAKTTYYSLNLALYELSGVDENFNPIPIEKHIPMWSKNDIALKLSLLGSFFETYFLPIHMDIIKCTIEDIVFTNNIRLFSDSSNSTDVHYLTSEYVKCNINDGDSFVLTNTSAQVSSNTLFNTGIQPGAFDNNTNYKTYIMGVDKVIKTISNDDDLKLFMSQLFTGVGVVVNIKFEIPLISGDFIHTENLFIKTNNNRNWVNSETHYIVKENKNKGIFEFNILCREESQYDLKINFITGTGKILSKYVKFNVIDDAEINIGVFRVKSKTPSLKDWFDGPANDYYISRQPNILADTNIIQYIPVDKYYKSGIRLNNVLIFLYSSEDYPDDENRFLKHYFDENYEYLRDNYFITHNDKIIRNDNGDIIRRDQYTVCVSKEFDHDPTDWLNAAYDSPKKHIYKNTYEYFSEFHYLEELTGNTLKDYTAYDNDALCVVPFISGDRNNVLKYSKEISEPEWIFENITSGNSIVIPYSIREPYISNNDFKSRLSPGYYNIIFRYKLDGVLKTIKLSSAFRKIKGIDLAAVESGPK